jgi:exonuclease VII large subunit
MFHSPRNLWQKAKANLQPIVSSPQAQQAQKLARHAVQRLSQTAQEWHQQTEELWQSEGVRHLRHDVSQTAQNFTQKASTVLQQVTATVKTAATDWLAHAKEQLQSSFPSKSDKN